MKLERHMAVAIGDKLHQLSTALHGRGNALPGVLVRTGGHDACQSSRRRRATRDDTSGWIGVLGAPTA